ncbi:hypothetical protein [Halalkalibacillus halophilus]|uniref:hypothetical protein n=1 Tax=Halalkalibacillus halophilus TaxID=392827 RepID=UPI000407C1EC|nr:hypothetical protein [Halalkalibacillus halophilus]
MFLEPMVKEVMIKDLQDKYISAYSLKGYKKSIKRKRSWRKMLKRAAFHLPNKQNKNTKEVA